MQNSVPDRRAGSSAGSVGVAERTVRRTLASRWETYADEVRRLIDAGKSVMARDGTVDPKVSEIVRAAGLSNQAFYRHFPSKDELLLAILDDGLQHLVAYLEKRMAAAGPSPAGQVRAWILGVLAQAGNDRAAAATRPFVINTLRLADRFPAETAASRDALHHPLRAALAAADSRDPDRDAAAIYELAMGAMHRAIVEQRRPSRAEIDHLVAFAEGGYHG